MLHLGDQASLTTIYTMPTSGDAKNFVLSKFDPMIERSEGLASNVGKAPLTGKAVFNTVVKRIGNSYYFFRGSWAAHGAQSIDADVIVVDELDFQNQEVKSMWEERTEGSSSQDVIYWVGYPSIKNFGMEELYEQSDQRKWYIECGHCYKRQTLEWPDNVNFETRQYQCKFCKGVLSDDMRRKGLWKITKPDQPRIHGYSINKLMAPWISADKIIYRFENDTPKKFMNYTLGLPYQSSDTEMTDKVMKDITIDEATMLQMIGDKEWKRVVGIDQGDIFHMFAGIATENFLIITHAHVLKTEDELINKIKRYNPDCVVMDMLPNKHTSLKVLKEIGKDRFFMGKERNWSESNKFKDYWVLDRAHNEVSIEHTESLDSMMDMVMEGGVFFRDDIKNLYTKDKKHPGVFDMMMNIIPDVQERFGRMRRIWKKVGEDHFAHSLNFSLVATRILFPYWKGMKEVVQAPVQKLDTPKPWYIKDYEKRVQGLVGGNSIIIPVLGSKRDRDDIIPRDI